MAKQIIKKPKFKTGDMVYSWQNPTYKARVSHINPATEYGYNHQYKVSLRDKEGYSHSSKWMGEPSLHKTRKEKDDKNWLEKLFS